MTSQKDHKLSIALDKAGLIVPMTFVVKPSCLGDGDTGLYSRSPAIFL